MRAVFLVGLIALVSAVMAAALSAWIGGVAEPGRPAPEATPTRAEPAQVDQTFYVMAYHWDFAIFTGRGSRLDTLTVPQGTAIAFYAVNAYAEEAINKLPAPVADAMRGVPVPDRQAIIAAQVDPSWPETDHGFLIDKATPVRYPGDASTPVYLAADAKEPARVVWTALRLGEYEFVCLNYCGAGHISMTTQTRFIVQPGTPLTPTPTPAATPPPGNGAAVPENGAALGREIFTGDARVVSIPCSTCHNIGRDAAGPDLAGVASKAAQRVAGTTAREYLTQSVLDPGAYVVEGWPAVMPSYQGQMTDEELNALIDYLLTLK